MDTLVFLLQKEVAAMDITGPKGHPRSRPPAVEVEAANRAVSIAETLGNTICMVDPGVRSAAATCGGGSHGLHVAQVTG